MVELHGDQRGLVQDEKSKSVELSGSTGSHGSVARDARQSALAQFVKSGLEQDLFHGGLNVLPDLLQAAGIFLRAGIAPLQIELDATGLREFAVDHAENFADGNALRRSREGIAAADAAMAGQQTGALEQEQNLFQIFQRYFVVLRNFVNGDHLRIFQAEVKDRFRRVLALRADSHSRDSRQTAFHRPSGVSTLAVSTSRS